MNSNDSTKNKRRYTPEEKQSVLDFIAERKTQNKRGAQKEAAERFGISMVAIGADHEDIAIREAHRLNIPVCVLVDTNADPKEIDFPIPGNDDAVRSIRLILDCIVKAINEGKGASAEA